MAGAASNATKECLDPVCGGETLNGDGPLWQGRVDSFLGKNPPSHVTRRMGKEGLRTRFHPA